MATSIPVFDDTETAFTYKSDAALRRAHLIFSIVNNPTTSAMATGLVKFGLTLHLPIHGLIRATVFGHFCGGETIEKSQPTIDALHRYGVGTILDYSVEGAKDEAGFDATAQQILHTIRKAKGNEAIPFAVFKMTGLASFDLLEKVHRGETLTDAEAAAWDRVQQRVNAICQTGFESNVPVLIDAEDSWIQNPIDALTYAMMAKYNREKAIVFNTYQMYRKDMLANLKTAFAAAEQQGYYLGAKLVRGAYMEKEAERAGKLNYENPIHATKADTDQAFNEGLVFCVENRRLVSLVCGSHNEYSNQYLVSLIEKHGISPRDPHVWFAQLLGMSDNISFNLAKAGFNVVKYVPYGPVASVMPYLLRRAAENTSVAGQSSRELLLIRKELARRRNGK